AAARIAWIAAVGWAGPRQDGRAGDRRRDGRRAVTSAAVGRPATGRLEVVASTPSASLGVRVVLDARPLQEPDRAPLTATYLDRLLTAYDAQPIDGESFALLLRSA